MEKPAKTQQHHDGAPEGEGAKDHGRLQGMTGKPPHLPKGRKPDFNCIVSKPPETTNLGGTTETSPTPTDPTSQTPTDGTGG